MRNAFSNKVLKLSETDESIILLSADIGNRLFDDYKKVAPSRFLNCGIAEANMISMAAGLASCGFRPICYTIAPFITTRCLEQIKVDVCYHKEPVIIVGTGSGLAYASLGATHHSFEDIGILRPMPNLNILAPADANELEACLDIAVRSCLPTYIRIGKKGEPVLLPKTSIEFGKWNKVSGTSDADVTLLASGVILDEAIKAAALLKKANISTQVISCASIKPLDTDFLNSLDNTVVTIEEHSIIGGFGSAVAEYLMDNNFKGRLLRFGIPDYFLHDCGEQLEARNKCGLTAHQLVDRILQINEDRK